MRGPIAPPIPPKLTPAQINTQMTQITQNSKPLDIVTSLRCGRRSSRRHNRLELIAQGIELVRDWHTREPFDLRERVGIRVCDAMAKRGVLTRPVGNVIVLMPPYCTTPAQVRRMVEVLGEAIGEAFRPKVGK